MSVISITPNLSTEVTVTTAEILADLTYPESGLDPTGTAG